MRRDRPITAPSPDCALDRAQHRIGGAVRVTDAEAYLRTAYQEIGHPPSPTRGACGSMSRARDAYRILAWAAGTVGIDEDRCREIWAEAHRR